MRIAKLLCLTGILAALVTMFVVAPPFLASGDGLNLTYIANEGVLLEGGGRKVLLDALFRSLAGYPSPSDATRADMEAARGRFAAVDLALATHYHADHFDAATAGAHLAANPRATLVAVRQVTEALARGFPGHARIAPRVLEVTPEFGARKDLTVADLPLSVLRLRHGNTMNAGFLLTLGGKKVLHVGDGDGTVENFAPLKLEREGIDVALLPYWYALDDEGAVVIRNHIRPRRLVFFHIPEDEPDAAELKEHMQQLGGRAGLAQKIKALFPQAILLLEPMSRVTF